VLDPWYGLLWVYGHGKTILAIRANVSSPSPPQHDLPHTQSHVTLSAHRRGHLGESPAVVEAGHQADEQAKHQGGGGAGQGLEVLCEQVMCEGSTTLVRFAETSTAAASRSDPNFLSNQPRSASQGAFRVKPTCRNAVAQVPM
jgi:hypothetical protein